MIDHWFLTWCCSNSGQKKKLNFTTAKLIDFFGENVFSSYEIGSWKPEPGIYLHAVNNMAFLPSECAVIDDSLPGIQAAKAGGFDVFGFTVEKNKTAFEESGATVFFNMDELEYLLNLNYT